MGKNRGFVPPQKNGMMERFKRQLEAEFDARERFQTDFLLQVGCDAFLMAAADVFKLGPGRAKKAMEAYRDYVMRIMDAVIENGGQGRSGKGENLDYFWTDLDRRLKQICGDSFTPHEERYEQTGLRLFAELFLRTVKGMKFGRPEDVPQGAAAATLNMETADESAEAGA